MKTRTKMGLMSMSMPVFWALRMRMEFDETSKGVTWRVLSECNCVWATRLSW
jgi:hypothetical protein